MRISGSICGEKWNFLGAASVSRYLPIIPSLLVHMADKFNMFLISVLSQLFSNMYAGIDSLTFTIIFITSAF